MKNHLSTKTFILTVALTFVFTASIPTLSFAKKTDSSETSDTSTDTSTSNKPSNAKNKKETTTESNISLEQLLGNEPSIEEPSTDEGVEASEESLDTLSLETMSLMSTMSTGGAGGSSPESLNSNFGFDPYSGSSSITLPLYTPQGRKGVQPTLRFHIPIAAAMMFLV